MSTYYVSTTGNNGNSGAENSPFLTIGYAATRATSPGDTVIVENGTYNWTNSGQFMAYLSSSGSSGSPITFRARNNQLAILNGSSNAGLAAFRITAAYISLSGFEIKGFLNVGIEMVSGAAYVNISDLHVHDIGRQCTTEGDGSGITMAAVDNVTVERCLFHDEGAYAPGENGCTYPVGYTGYQTLYHGVYLTGSNITIKNNVFYNIRGGFGVQVYANAGYATTNLKIINNTFENGNPYQAAGHIILANNVTTALIANNIFKDHYSYAINVYGGGYVYSGILITKNMTAGGNGQTKTGVTSGVTSINNYESTNPLFVNEVNHNYALTSSSPAINTGYNTGLTTDYLSNPRSTIDIGAFEYQASVTTTTTQPLTTTTTTKYGTTTTTTTIFQQYKTYYVSTIGLDGNNGSFASPFLTFLKAASVAVAGDTVYFREGTYAAPKYVNPCNNGTFGHPITYSAYQNETVIFNFSSATPYNYGMYFYKNNYLTFNKLRFVRVSGSVTAAIRFYDCSNIEINSCDVSGGVTCIRIENSRSDTRKSGFKILNSYVHHPDANGCVFLSNKISDILIDNCEMAYAPITGGIGYDGIYISGSGGDTAEWTWNDAQIYDVAPRNIIVSNCRLHDNGRQGILNIGGCDFTFDNNACYNNGATGIQIENNAINGIVQNNHCYDNSHLFPAECGIWINNCKDLIVRYNLCERNIVNIKSTTKTGYVRGTTGISIYYNITIDGYSGTTEYNVASLVLEDTEGFCSNNTFIRSGHTPASLGQANVDNITIKNCSMSLVNNIIYNSESLQDIYVITSLSTTVIDNNLYYNSGRAFKARVNSFTTVYTFNEYKALTGFDTHSLITDPLFVSPADLQLQSTSPAINMGTSMGLTRDYSGQTVMGLPDIGAYENISGTTTTTTQLPITTTTTQLPATTTTTTTQLITTTTTTSTALPLTTTTTTRLVTTTTTTTKPITTTTTTTHPPTTTTTTTQKPLTTTTTTTILGGVYWNAKVEGTASKNNCPSGYTTGPIVYTVPENTYNSVRSQIDADNKAIKKANRTKQSYANTYGVCIPPIFYYSTELRLTSTKNDCPVGYVGSLVTYVVPAGKYSSTISQIDADNKALNDLNSNNQIYANNRGGCKRPWWTWGCQE